MNVVSRVLAGLESQLGPDSQALMPLDPPATGELANDPQANSSGSRKPRLHRRFGIRSARVCYFDTQRSRKRFGDDLDLFTGITSRMEHSVGDELAGDQKHIITRRLYHLVRRQRSAYEPRRRRIARHKAPQQRRGLGRHQLVTTRTAKSDALVGNVAAGLNHWRGQRILPRWLVYARRNELRIGHRPHIESQQRAEQPRTDVERVASACVRAAP